MIRFSLILLLYLISIFPNLPAQEGYIPPADPAVKKALDHWQDLKFGFMMHWGPYSQWGIVESWSLCSEDEPWCRRNAPDYYEYKKAYELLQTTFNPRDFDPQSWAEVAQDAGMKYVVFTTKHHDGFCMFDTKLTDYKVTSEICPFHTDPDANITKAIFTAFREKGFLTGAYFSKPDWHNDDYWWPYFSTPDRHVNYSPEKYPERWDRFKQFVHGQIEELMTGYGRVDILWLDGGWVRPRPGLHEHPWNQDIDMPSIAAMARKHQPGLIIVDRTVGGAYENYRTPEQRIPDKPLPYPWETCMTLGTSWSYNPFDHYKPAGEVIRILLDIVSKGGNLLLNVGPSPEGRLPVEAVNIMKETGQWLKINGDAIYNTRPVKPWKQDNIYYTRSGNGIINAIYLAGNNDKNMPDEIMLKGFHGNSSTTIELAGSSRKPEWHNSPGGMVISIPEDTSRQPPCHYAWTFRMSHVQFNPLEK